MKKLLVTLLLSVFLFGTLTNASAVTPGTSCKKAGLTSKKSGKLFTCIKLGKKLYWNNGVKVKNLPIINQTPIPSKPALPTELIVNLQFTGGEFSYSSWGTGLSHLYCDIPASAPVQPMFPNYAVSEVNWAMTNLKVYDGSGKLLGIASTLPKYYHFANGNCSVSFTLSDLVLSQGPIILQTGSSPRWVIDFANWSDGEINIGGDNTVISY